MQKRSHSHMWFICSRFGDLCSKALIDSWNAIFDQPIYNSVMCNKLSNRSVECPQTGLSWMAIEMPLFENTQDALQKKTFWLALSKMCQHHVFQIEYWGFNRFDLLTNQRSRPHFQRSIELTVNLLHLMCLGQIMTYISGKKVEK